MINVFGWAGLRLSSFDFDDLAKAVIPKVNELLYDTLAYVVKSDSAAEHFLLGTDSVSDRDGRRALLDLIKGCVPPGVRQTLQEEHSQLRYPARVDPRPLLAREQRLVLRDNRSEDWTPTEPSRKYKLFERLDPEFYAAVRVRYRPMDNRRALPLCHRCGREGEGKTYHAYKECPYGGKSAVGGTVAYCMPADGEGADEAIHTLALCQIFQVAADAGSEAFAAAVAEYGAPAVLAGGESDGIDVSAYGCAVSDSGNGVLFELESLTCVARWCRTVAVPRLAVHPQWGATRLTSVCRPRNSPASVVLRAAACPLQRRSRHTVVPPPDYWRPEGH
ncbi:hypothetical protein CYMTET_48819 [Cymbomonas tetramitiformis]|uniref:Uncharacterized protein n=1 Tax=Cymbomonas tetramitiformis TaxID=36881 RepID=A0AAE0BSK6_9CHLO|nr:hypothetical protein CYMTET_48819 [Cymbomonas tetramitiformis]